MRICYDVEKLNTIAHDLFSVLHLGVLIIDKDGNRLVKCYDPCDFCSVIQDRDESIHRACHESDEALIEECRTRGKPCAHICHMNLCDVVIPIIKDGIQAAYVLLGRIRAPGYTECVSGFDSEMEELYNNLPYFSENELESLKSLLSIILFGGAITFEETSIGESVRVYIEDNLTGDVSISAICKHFFISKNTLYKLFRSEYGCTVGEFISKMRTKVACDRLRNTDMTVLAIGSELGFESYAYFCRFFKSRTGQTPSEYRQNARITY